MGIEEIVRQNEKKTKQYKKYKNYNKNNFFVHIYYIYI